MLENNKEEEEAWCLGVEEVAVCRALQEMALPAGAPPEAPARAYLCWLFRNSIQTKDFSSQHWLFSQACPRFIRRGGAHLTLFEEGICYQRPAKKRQLLK